MNQNLHSSRTTKSITLDDYLKILDNNDRILTSRTELLLQKQNENSYIPAYCSPNLAKQYLDVHEQLILKAETGAGIDRTDSDRTIIRKSNNCSNTAESSTTKFTKTQFTKNSISNNVKEKTTSSSSNSCTKKTSTQKSKSNRKRNKTKNKNSKNRNSDSNPKIMVGQPLEKLSVAAALENSLSQKETNLSSEKLELELESTAETPATADYSHISESTDGQSHFDSLYESEIDAKIEKNEKTEKNKKNVGLKNNADSQQTLTYFNVGANRFENFSDNGEEQEIERLEHFRSGEAKSGKEANCTFESGFMTSSVYSNTSCFSNGSDEQEILLGGESVYGELPVLEQSVYGSIDSNQTFDSETENSKILTENTNTKNQSTSESDSEHKLNTPWTFWQITKTKYELQQDPSWTPVKIATFTSIEEFWYIFSRIKMPSSVAPKADFMIFREGVEPIWEDQANETGGCWKVILDKKSCKKNKIDRRFIDRIWLESILMVIGEQFYCDVNNKKQRKQLTMNQQSQEKINVSTNINGVYLQRRQKEDRLSLWTSIGSEATIENNIVDELALKSIGTTFKEIVKVTTNTPINFSAHEDQNNNKGKSLKYRQVVRYMV